MVAIATFIGLALASPVEVDKRVVGYFPSMGNGEANIPAPTANQQLFHALQDRRWSMYFACVTLTSG